ncbi:MAG: hypothetical protein ACW99Q_19515, partial [Candidatus Kariarchaeaceae archaeon]
EDELGETNIFDTSYSTYYELTYQIDSGDTVTEGKIDIYLYDLCGNNESISLTTTLDNNGPVSIIIEDVLGDELSDFLYYDGARELLFYSNYNPMAEPFTIRVNATDFGAGLKNATGEDEFNETGVVDTTHSGYFELTYDIKISEVATDNNITITIYDMCGNSNSFDFTTQIDNNGPQDVVISQVNDYGSKFIHLYNDSGSLTLFVSNRSTIDHKFTLTIDFNEPTDEVGYKLLIGGLYFGESYVNPSVTFVTYYLNTTDNVENGTLTLWAYDLVNNSNSVNLQIYGDLTNPSLLNNEYNFDDHGSDYLHNDSSQFFFSDNMPSTQTLTIFGTGTDFTGGSGVDRVSFETAFGSSPSTDLGAIWSADYGIDSTDPENDTGSGNIAITITDRVNNNYTFLVPYVVDNEDPSSVTINDIIEVLLAEYLHYVSVTTTLYYSNVQPGRGSRNFTVRVDSTDTGGSGLRYAYFPDIGTGFTSGGYDISHVGGMWEFNYLINNPAVASYNGSVIITVFDNVGNNETINFDLYHDDSPPQSLSLVGIIENSEYIYYNTGNEVFYFSNDQAMSEDFTIQLTATDAGSGRLKANASQFGNTVTNSTYGANGFELTFSIDQDDTAPTFSIRVWDNVENSEVFNLVTEIDNTAPQNLDIITVLETPGSDFLYYDGATLYFSNDQSMTATFTIRVNGTDFGSGRKNATGEEEFGDTGVGDVSYSTYYELVYQIVQNDNVSDGIVTIWLFDQVGNANSIGLSCIEDNTAPSIFISDVVESSYYFYYDSANTILYYSNVHSMSDTFTIRLTGSDSGVGRLNATGESDFGEVNVGDTVYISYYELSYNVSSGENASDDYITVQIFDRVGNSNSLNFDCILDNEAPDIVTLDSLIGADVSDYLYFSGTELFYSNDQSMSETFTLQVDVLEILAGVENVTGSLDFNEIPSTTSNASGTFNLQYTISQSEITNANDGNIQIFVWDRVGNLNSSLSLIITLDNDAPVVDPIND